MDLKTIQAIIQFMQRVNLQGAEVPAFVNCINALNKMAQDASKMESRFGPAAEPREAAE